MCIILDANSFGKFNDKSDEDMKPLQEWVYGQNGKIVYSDTEKFRSEWSAGGGYRLMMELLYQGSRPSTRPGMGWQQAMMTLRKRGKFKLISAAVVEKKADELEQIGALSSQDFHIIALAIIAEVKVLVSNDRRLHEDFKNRNLVGGSVYQTKSHSRLLTRDTCP